MAKSSFLAILKRTSVVTAVAVIMSVGSVANALDGLQLNQSIKTTNSVQSIELQLAHMVCIGNWVNAGCTSPPASLGNQGGQDPGTPTKDDCDKYTSASPTIILQAYCGSHCCESGT